jgi:small GTP-binding protein
MGFILSKIIEFFTRSRNNFKILLLGMQNAGKTTILYRLSLGQVVKTTPTIGSNVEELIYENVKFQAWDLGGQESTRSVWDVYYMNTDGVIYVIDSQDENNYEESKNQFHKIIKNATLKNSTILIFANKQDLPGAKTVEEIIRDYELDKIRNHSWKILSCSAIKGEGLIEGIKWLSEQLVFRGKNNFPNNPYETNENEGKENNQTNNVENSDVKITVNDIVNNLNDNNINNNAENNKEKVKEIESSENNINNENITNTNNIEIKSEE